MIDPTLRCERILKEAADPEMAVLLLDVVLGFGCHPDPAGALAEAVVSARELTRARGADLAVVASICGTDGDIQGLESQEDRLRGVGVMLASSNAKAAQLAGMIARQAGASVGGAR
jgi:hypothetical protein